MSTTSWIRWLDKADDADELSEADDLPLAALGGKGANLRRLLRLGFPVPPGFVITTAAYRASIAAHSLRALGTTDPESLRERLIQMPMPDELGAAILVAYQRLGAGSVAVRSSGTAEDLATASFAGQHDTFLEVSGEEALLNAVRACWASLWTPRAVAYRRQRGWGDHLGDANDRTDGRTDGSMPLALAVVVQVMVPAEAAGVAFTANPVTADRNETTISAVRGLGERLVSGEGVADEWVVRRSGAGTEAICLHGAEDALTAEQALAVADLARRIEGHFGPPQDVEWALADGTLFVLQTRPMTALPTPAAPDALVESVAPTENVTPNTWASPAKGGWMRNFRLGEWLPEPVTPLCESWLLARIEEGEVSAEERDFGLRPRPPYHVLANGWYFSSPIGGGLPLRGVVIALTRHPRALLALALSTSRPDLAERSLIAPVARRWREELLPRYQRLVASWETRVETASPADLIGAIDAVAGVAGAYLWDFSVVGGHAWKAEHALARFCRKHLPEQAARGHQELLLGLPVRPVEPPTPYPVTPPHAVQSLDWIRPTLGEDEGRDGGREPSGTTEMDDLAGRRARMEANRRAAEAACRAALASHPALRRRFDALLALAQQYAVLREEQASWFTLGWPFLRRAILRLGGELRLHGAIAQTEDVFFLTRAEVEACLEVGRLVANMGRAGQEGPREEQERREGKADNDLRVAVTARRQAWDRQRRLSPPLVLGNPLGARLIARATDAMRAPAPGMATSTHAVPGTDGLTVLQVLRGMPASPGRATGPVRVIRGPEDFARFKPGEVLVAQVTAPAWTPLFGRAAAVVTDGGSLAAHASLVAREYGIPAVVAAGDATVRLRDGQRVTVDGNAGIVQLLA